tara:strand:+ start:2191 stop:3576 length:1386 start_codon:yes stop_codon:yes gene_type:complete
MDLDYRHPLYEANLGRWNYYRASYLGGFDYRNSSLGMLRKYLFEDDAPGDQYSQRLEYTALDNMTKLTVDTYRSFLFRSTPTRTFGYLSGDLTVNRFIEDVDFSGKDLDDFMKEANDLATVYGNVWILCTKGQVEGVFTKEQEIAANIRPYLKLFTPESVCDWSYETMPNGQEKLVYVKTKEWLGDDHYKYIVWTPDVFVMYEVKGEDIVATEEYENAIGEVPFVIHYANPTHHKGIGYSDIADVAKAQQAVFNLLSEAEQSIRISGHPTLVKTQDVSAQAGAGSVINMDNTMDSNLRPYLLEPSGTSITSITDMINVHIENFLRSTHLGAIMAARGLSVKSGVALATEFEMLNTRLADKSAKMEATEWNIWRLFFKWNGTEPDLDFNIEYSKTFDLRDEHADLKLLSEALEVGVDSPTFVKEVQKQIAKLVISDGDVLDSIFKEIDTGSNNNALQEEEET